MEIKENEVYTHEETQEILKVSSSTVTRMIKKGLIKAAKGLTTVEEVMRATNIDAE